jgi:hypothetical protein
MSLDSLQAKKSLELTHPLYWFAIGVLGVGALWMLGYAIYKVLYPHGVPAFDHRLWDFRYLRPSFDQLPVALGAVILGVIFIELMETIRGQISGPLSLKLVMDFLIIGIVAAVRHLLIIGADLSNSGSKLEGLKDDDLTQAIRRRNTLFQEFWWNLVLIGVLIVGVFFVHYVEERGKRSGVESGT